MHIFGVAHACTTVHSEQTLDAYNAAPLVCVLWQVHTNNPTFIVYILWWALGYRPALMVPVMWENNICNLSTHGACTMRYPCLLTNNNFECIMKDSKQKTRTCEACIMEAHAYYQELVDNVMYATKTNKTALFLHAL